MDKQPDKRPTRLERFERLEQVGTISAVICIVCFAMKELIDDKMIDALAVGICIVSVIWCLAEFVSTIRFK